MNQYLKLAKRIEKFLSKYGVKGADGEWNGPDSNELECVAQVLRQNNVPSRHPWSEWGSGCYRPYNSKDGQVEHGAILNEIALIHREHFKRQEL